MCCFSQPVLSVSNTRLFARLLSPGRQALAYQMNYRSELPNAMILPLPVAAPAKDDSVRFVSLKEYDSFFDDLERAFPELPQPPTAAVDSRAASEPQGNLLAVHEVGDFVASFVPTMDDFARLDPQFVISRESWSQIPGYEDFGFAVFQLKALAGKPHPIAFEFNTRWPERIFYPTVHIHDGQVHDREDFDHALYVQHPRLDEAVGRYQGPRRRDAATGWVRSKGAAASVCDIKQSQGLLAAQQLVHRRIIRGNFLNRDVVHDVASFQPARGTSPGFGWWRWTPWALAAAGGAWFLGRRSAVARAERRQRANAES